MVDLAGGCGSGIPGTSVSINPTCDADSLTPEAFLNCILNFQQDSAVSWSGAATDLAGSAVCSAKGADWSISRTEKPYDVEAREPSVPEVDNAVTTYGALQNVMLPLFGKTFDDYFDRNHAILYNPAYQAAASWMVSVIAGGVSGIPVNLEAQIYGREADRIRAEAAVAKQNTIDGFHSRGWNLPQPCALALGQNAELSQLRSLGDVSVRVAEKQIDIQIDSIRFAVSEANKIYLGMERNAIDYISAWTRLLDSVKDLSSVDPNVKANLINATANLYGKRIQADQVQWMAINDFQQRIQDDNKLRSSNELGKTGLVVQANTAAAEVMKMLAAAVLSQLTTMVSKVVSG